MTTKYTSNALLIYGLYMVIMGVLSFVFIGSTAKTALLSGGSMGLIAILFSFFVNKEKTFAIWGGLFQSLSLIGIFAWRGSISFLTIFEKLELGEPILGKSVAFLVIMSMFMMSLFVFTIQVMYLKNNLEISKK